MTTCDGQIGQTGYCNKCGHVAMTSSSYCGRLIEVPQNEIKAMSKAEKKWRKWDEVNPVFGSLSREAYKAALRREIEKQIDFYNAMAKAAETKSEYIEALRIIDGLGITIEILDTVEP